MTKKKESSEVVTAVRARATTAAAREAKTNEIEGTQRARVRFAVAKSDAPDLVIVYTFKAGRFTLTGAQARAIAKKLGYTKTKSWTEGGRYVTVPSAKLVGMLTRFAC